MTALDPENTRVSAKLAITRQRADAPLVLHGEELKLVSIALDGKVLADDDYRQDAKSLTIASVPDRFVLETVCEIAPAANTSWNRLSAAASAFWLATSELWVW